MQNEFREARMIELYDARIYFSSRVSNDGLRDIDSDNKASLPKDHMALLNAGGLSGHSSMRPDPLNPEYTLEAKIEDPGLVSIRVTRNYSNGEVVEVEEFTYSGNYSVTWLPGSIQKAPAKASDKGEGVRMMSFQEMMALPYTKKDGEHSYRRGYMHGMQAVLDILKKCDLKTRLEDFIDGPLMRWRAGDCNKMDMPPSLLSSNPEQGAHAVSNRQIKD